MSGLPQIPNGVDGPRRPGDLAARVVTNTKQELTRYGRHLREEDIVSLDAVAETIEAMAYGRAKPKLFLSTQPTGWGKTAILVAAVQAIVSDPALAHIGIVVMVNSRDQIDALIDRLELREDEYAVRVDKNEIDWNERGLTGLCKTKKAKQIAHRFARVLFTTQQKLSNGLMLHNRDFDEMRFFDYCGPASADEIEILKKAPSCGQKRQVRLWDEAYLPVDPVIITTEQIAAFTYRLASLGQQEAAAGITHWLENLDEADLDYAKVPDWPLHIRWSESDADKLFDDLAEGDKAWRLLYEAMSVLPEHTVKIVRQDYNKKTVAVSYRRSVPYNIEPLLIFDASGNEAVEYRFLEKNQGNVVQLPPATKTYRNVIIRFFDHKAGQAAYRSKENIDVLASAAAQAVINKSQGDDVLIVHRKGEKAPATTLPALIKSKVTALGGDERRLHFITWGNHRATNAYQQKKHVILVGVLQAPLSAIISMVYGTSGKPMRATVSKIDVEIMRMSRMIGDINQAVGRGAVRQMTGDGDVPHGCTVDIIASSVGPLGFKEPLDTLKTMFPGALVKAWHPNIPNAKPSMDMLLVDAALSLLGDRREVLIASNDWASKAGYSTRTLQRRINKGLIFDLLAEHKIKVQKQGQKWLLQKDDGMRLLQAA